MHLFRILFFSLLALPLSACGTVFIGENASGHMKFSKEQCVPYAREVSGINIRGDAWTWWDQAEGKYMRGHKPMPGSILVLAKTKRLRSGHLAVVKEIISPREIDVTHTNWGDDWASRRITYNSMRAQDVSPHNDWSNIRFWNREEDVFGFPYPAKGFIYKVRAQ